MATKLQSMNKSQQAHMSASTVSMYKKDTVILSMSVDVSITTSSIIFEM